MLRYLMTLFQKLKEKTLSKDTRWKIVEASWLALRKYKVAVMKLHKLSGPARTRLIERRAAGGSLWSTRQFNRILAKILRDCDHLTYSQCRGSIPYDKLKQDFDYWSKKFFASRS